MTQMITPLLSPSVTTETGGCTFRRNAADLTATSFLVEGRAADGSMAVVDAQRVGHVRRIVAARLRYLGLAVLLDPVLLVVSELVTNAVEHTAAPGGSVTVTQVFARGELHLLVQDDGRGLPRVQAAGPEAESGRGLYLVDCVTAELGGRWGHSLGTGTVWCVIPVPRAGP